MNKYEIIVTVNISSWRTYTIEAESIEKMEQQLIESIENEKNNYDSINDSIINIEIENVAEK